MCCSRVAAPLEVWWGHGVIGRGLVGLGLRRVGSPTAGMAGWGDGGGGGLPSSSFFDINAFQDDICSIFFRDVCYICVLLNYSTGLKDDNNKMLED
jgi:hypothetical protein